VAFSLRLGPKAGFFNGLLKAVDDGARPYFPHVWFGFSLDFRAPGVGRPDTFEVGYIGEYRV